MVVYAGARVGSRCRAAELLLADRLWQLTDDREASLVLAALQHGQGLKRKGDLNGTVVLFSGPSSAHRHRLGHQCRWILERVKGIEPSFHI